MFLPETLQPVQAAKVDLTVPVADASGDVALMQRILSAAVQNPSLIPPDFMAYVVDFIQTQRLTTPIGQVIGFQRFLSTQVQLFPGAGTTSLSGTGSSSVAGPTVDATAGEYFVVAGADMSTQFGNGDAHITVSAGFTVFGSQASTASLAKGMPYTLAADGPISSTLVINGGGGSVNCNISAAWLVAIRYANL